MGIPQSTLVVQNTTREVRVMQHLVSALDVLSTTYTTLLDFIGALRAQFNLASWLSNQRAEPIPLFPDYSCQPEFI
ncbi:hypothetical protein OH492_10155 [Vibrio chagasii]|nr:hypothetical protein [Vibrio chagasii]